MELLRLEADNVRCTLAPERGALATSLVVSGRELLYLDVATLEDPTKNVRGGVPVLFPSPGKLGDGRYSMPQHGFARTVPWTVVESSPSAATLRLTANERTRAQYPFDFALTFRFSLLENGLRIDQHVDSEGAFGLGFHPYFLVADKAHARVPTQATRAWDNVEKHDGPLQPFDFAHGEVDLHLLDHGRTDATLELADARIAVRGSAQFRRWVLWTLPGREFICVEPWTSPTNALNTGDGVLSAPQDLWVTITLE